MVKNSQEGNRERAARRRRELAARGIRQVQLFAPESAHLLLRQAVELMTQEGAPVEPRAALRQAGGANEPDAAPELRAELEAIKSQMNQAAEAQRLEIEAKERQRQALEAERDAARAAETAEREKAQATATEAQAAAKTAQEAQERATEALGRAEKAETAIRQARSLPGARGRLMRWLAGDALR
jgi:chromosome segregation ATPase